MHITSQWEDKEFSATLRELNRRVQAPSYAPLVKIAAARVVKTCIRYTPQPSAKVVTQRARRRAASKFGLTKAPEPGMMTINIGAHGPYGRLWMRTASGKWRMVLDAGFAKTGRHLSDADWTDAKEAIEDFRSELKRTLPLARSSRGLARNSWYQALEDLGVPIDQVPPLFNIPANVRNARPANGRIYANGTATPNARGQHEFIITITNTYPYQETRTHSFRRILSQAQATARKATEIDLRKGIFDDVKALEKRWPILVTPA